jgi:hypothetical protein
MKITELINTLTLIRELHGDIECYRAGYSDEMEEINNIELTLKYKYKTDDTEKEVRVRI